MRAWIVERGKNDYEDIKDGQIGWVGVYWDCFVSPASLDHTLWPCWKERVYWECVHSAVFVCYFYMYICFLHLCSHLSLCSIVAVLFICGRKVAHTWALSISFQQCSLPANPLAVILRYIYVLGAEWRLAVTCVREVVALMEFYTWQPSRQCWYVFKILSRNNTCFCCLLGQVELFLSLMAPGGPGV